MDHAADAHRTDLMTITRYMLNEQSKRPESRGDFTILLSHIVLGCKFVCSAINKDELAKLIGLVGETNVQGEEQKKLDVLSNEVYVKALVSSGCTCILASEEDEEATFVEPSLCGKYCVVFDPLDGSSNINCGASIGTEPEELFETISQALLSSVDRDCLSGWGGHVLLVTPTEVQEKTLKGRMD